MNDKVLLKIANDLKIDRFADGLTETEFRCAVIYSAAALWAKISSQDILNDIEQGSRRHVLKVCSTFLNYALEDENETIKEYFYKTSNGSKTAPQTIIVDSLIRAGELIETGLDSNNFILSLPEDSVRQILDDLQIVSGSIRSGKDYEYMSGLSFIYSDDDGLRPYIKDSCKLVENYIVQLSKMTPTRYNESDEDRYFDIYDWGKSRFSRKRPHNDYPFEIVMNRMVDGEKFYIRTKKGFYQFDELELELKTHYRFMIYLCKHFDIKTFQLIENKEVLYVKGFHALPLYEDSFIRSVFWPMRDIEDAAWFFGPKYIKPFICKVLTGLGVEYDEK